MGVILVYLPPAHGVSREQEWMDEVDGLESDILQMRTMVGEAAGVCILVLGDINVEPAELGAAEALFAARRKRWTSLMQSQGVTLANPAAQGNMSHKVWLPIRQKTVDVGTGCTHHCSGRSRSIDVIGYTGRMDVQVLVHNGVHCKGAGACDWQQCVEYTLGDHFLLEACIRDADVESSEAGSLRMPRWWQDMARWEKGLLEAEEALREIFQQRVEGRLLARDTRGHGRREDGGEGGDGVWW